MTGKQVRFLKQLAHSKKPIFQIGKDGVNENQVSNILECLENNELIKVKMLDNCTDSKSDILDTFTANEIQVIQVIGNTFILYKKSTKLDREKRIRIPAE